MLIIQTQIQFLISGFSVWYQNLFIHKRMDTHNQAPLNRVIMFYGVWFGKGNNRRYPESHPRHQICCMKRGIQFLKAPISPYLKLYAFSFRMVWLMMVRYVNLLFSNTKYCNDKSLDWWLLFGSGFHMINCSKNKYGFMGALDLKVCTLKMMPNSPIWHQKLSCAQFVAQHSYEQHCTFWKTWVFFFF